MFIYFSKGYDPLNNFFQITIFVNRFLIINLLPHFCLTPFFFFIFILFFKLQKHEMLNDLNTEIKNRSYNLFLDFAQRATFGIKLPFEQYQDCNLQFKNKK